MTHLYCDIGSAEALLAELQRIAPAGQHRIVDEQWLHTDAPLEAPLAFARQALPNATEIIAPSINAFAAQLAEAIITTLPQDVTWRLHVVPHYGEFRDAGRNRCDLIVKAADERVQKKRRRLLKSRIDSASPWSPGEWLVQLWLLSPEHGVLSVASVDEAAMNLWPRAKGEIPIASDKAAPARAFAKLVEAELRLGRRIEAGEHCVDLGAAPGSWTYVAVERGAHVFAVDRSELRDDLMSSELVEFVQGDAFKYRPPQPVDWLICDIIAAPERSIALVIEWLTLRLCKHVVLTIKFIGQDQYAQLEGLKAQLPALCSHHRLLRLCANKNEVTVLASALPS